MTLNQDAISMLVTHWGEVAQLDCYHLRTLPFEPKWILDLGGNTGDSLLWSSILFPDAKVVAVEPDAWNFDAMQRIAGRLQRVEVIKGALGSGPVHHQQSPNPQGGNQVFLSAGIGYPQDAVDAYPPVDLDWRPLEGWLDPDYADVESFVKVDVEGAENGIFESAASLESLSRVTAFAMELHYYATNGSLVSAVQDATHKGIGVLRQTHRCTLENIGPGGDTNCQLLRGIKRDYPEWK